MRQLSDPVHWSNLRHMMRSPKHYRSSILEPKPQTPAMRLGALVHGIVLGHSDAFAVFDGERRSKKWDAFRDEHVAHGVALDRIFTTAEVGRAERCADAIARHPRAAYWLRDCRTELPVTWTMGRRVCATRGIDALGRAIVELKTTTNASASSFGWRAKSMGYMGQLAFYAYAARSIGADPLEHVIIAAETAPPFDVTTHVLSMRAKDMWQRTVVALLERLQVCEESGEWPGCSDADLMLDVEDDSELIYGDEEAA